MVVSAVCFMRFYFVHHFGECSCGVPVSVALFVVFRLSCIKSLFLFVVFRLSFSVGFLAVSLFSALALAVVLVVPVGVAFRLCSLLLLFVACQRLNSTPFRAVSVCVVLSAFRYF